MSKLKWESRIKPNEVLVLFTKTGVFAHNPYLAGILESSFERTVRIKNIERARQSLFEIYTRRDSQKNNNKKILGGFLSDSGLVYHAEIGQKNRNVQRIEIINTFTGNLVYGLDFPNDRPVDSVNFLSVNGRLGYEIDGRMHIGGLPQFAEPVLNYMYTEDGRLIEKVWTNEKGEFFVNDFPILAQAMQDEIDEIIFARSIGTEVLSRALRINNYGSFPQSFTGTCGFNLRYG